MVTPFSNHQPSRARGDRALLPFTFGQRANRKLASALASAGLLLLALSLCSCSLLGPLIGAALPLASAKIYFACIPQFTLVDTPSGPRAIEKLEAGGLVIGYSGKPVRILQKHSYMENRRTAFLRITFDDGAIVDLCGMHRIAGVRARELQIGQQIAARQIISIKTRHGMTHSYDLLTEDAGYQIHGVAVNSMIEEMNAAARSHALSARR